MTPCTFIAVKWLPSIRIVFVGCLIVSIHKSTLKDLIWRCFKFFEKVEQVTYLLSLSRKRNNISPVPYRKKQKTAVSNYDSQKIIQSLIPSGIIQYNWPIYGWIGWLCRVMSFYWKSLWSVVFIHFFLIADLWFQVCRKLR